MTVFKPSLDTLHELGERAGFNLSEYELKEYSIVTEALFGMLEQLDAGPSAIKPPMEATREIIGRAKQGEDPYNAILYRCRVKSGDSGVLSGKRVAVKDTISIAGIPQSFAAKMIELENYVPAVDAVIVERLLKAGAEIVATLNMDGFAWSHGGDTGDYGSILNPHDITRTAAGSSGGSGAALYYDDIDITIGGDQAGSIRYPGSWCGVLALKPTHGLVPYTGSLSCDPTIDHNGPLARTTIEMAACMDAIAGSDPSDPRQRYAPPVGKLNFVGALENRKSNLSGVRVGVLQEGLSDIARVTPEMRNAFSLAVDNIRALGAEVVDISIPEHLAVNGIPVPAIAFGIYMEGVTALIQSGGNGYGYHGSYVEDLPAVLRRAVKNNGNKWTTTLKAVQLIGNWAQVHHPGGLYAKAQNLRRLLREAYDRALSEVDFILMPTAPFPAMKHVGANEVPLSEKLLRGWSALTNCPQTDLTGHPALSMPAAEVDGLPAGVMVVGRSFCDHDVVAFAGVYEKAYGWVPTRKIAH